MSSLEAYAVPLLFVGPAAAVVIDLYRLDDKSKSSFGSNDFISMIVVPLVVGYGAGFVVARLLGFPPIVSTGVGGVAAFFSPAIVKLVK